MFRIIRNDFKIITKYKTFLSLLDNYLDNVPRRDMYYKDYIRNTSLDLLDCILRCNNDSDFKKYYVNIMSKISLLDFLLERLYDKRYISEKNLYKISILLKEIHDMTSKWIENGSKIK